MPLYTPVSISDANANASPRHHWVNDIIIGTMTTIGLSALLIIPFSSLLDGINAERLDRLVWAAIVFVFCYIPWKFLRMAIDPAYKKAYLNYIDSLPPMEGGGG